MDGLLILSKPSGLTSSQVVEKVRKRLRTKAGHTGTLDPLARGVLLVLLGKATRFSWIFTELKKRYRVRGRLGIETDTYDVEGNVLREREVSVSCDQLREVLQSFRGEIEQTPPPFSAKKVGGKRAYRLARRGVKPPLKPVRVRVYEIELLSCEIPHFEVEVLVSSGTYVRSLIHDAGQKLSTGAIVTELIRTQVGPFGLDAAVDLDRFLKDENPRRFVVPVEEGLSFLPAVSLDRFRGERILHGNPVPLGGEGEGYVRIYIDDLFVGVGKLSGGILRPERLIPPKT